jgi:thiol:disulfide interchange protein DsbD
MKKLTLLLCWTLVVFGTTTLLAQQMVQPVKWKTNVQSLDKGEFLVKFTAHIDKGFYIYSQTVGDGGPLPTEFDFSQAKDITVIGKTSEKSSHVKEGMDPMFEMNVKKFAEEVTFETKVKLNKTTAKCKVPVNYMSCNDEKCVKLDDELTFELMYEKKTEAPNKATPTITSTANNNVVSPSGNGNNAEQIRRGPAPLNPSNNTTETAKHLPGSSIVAPRPDATTTNTSNSLEQGKNIKAPTSPTADVAPIAESGGIQSPPTWEKTIENLGDNTYLVKFTATLPAGHYIYSNKIAAGGPLPTSFTFDQGSTPLGEMEEISKHRKAAFDSLFNMEVVKYSDMVTFQQKIKLESPSDKLSGTMSYMICDAVRCTPFEDTFDVPTATANTTIVAAKSIKTVADDAFGLWIFLLGFMSGLAAFIMPCIFPMVPLTVSMFTKRAQNRSNGVRDALIYALSIIVIYVTLGMLVSAIFGAAALNEFSTNPWVNIAFFVLFLFFAFSFFGYYEITLPSWMTTSADAAVDKTSGLTSIFLMAFTLSLTSFSCTGPLIGSLVVKAAEGAWWHPALGMAGFATALALPFGLFALFPSWLSNLPKSGGWLNSVKVVLGFLEIILAIKFLSNADLVKQWGLLKRETFLILWIALFFLTAIYILGFIRFPHDSPVKNRWSWQRLTFAAVFLLIGISLVPGLMGKPLPVGLMAGFPPPLTYSYGHQTNSHGNKTKSHCPHGLDCYHDYAEGLAAAKAAKKPIFIDFTGWACVNCRKMEENVWNQPGVLEKLQNDFVLISLYVDEKVDLPTEKQTEYTDFRGRTKQFKTVGDHWAYMQTSCYQTNSQPYYPLLDPNENVLVNPPMGNLVSVQNFATYLQKGIDNFKAGKSEGRPSCDYNTLFTAKQL